MRKWLIRYFYLVVLKIVNQVATCPEGSHSVLSSPVILA